MKIDKQIWEQLMFLIAIDREACLCMLMDLFLGVWRNN